MILNASKKPAIYEKHKRLKLRILFQIEAQLRKKIHTEREKKLNKILYKWSIFKWGRLAWNIVQLKTVKNSSVLGSDQNKHSDQ